MNTKTKVINSTTITYIGDIKVINSPEKYVTPEVVLEFFTKGKINQVDKVLTGNGVTTAFGDIDAGFTTDGKKRFLVLVEPNVETVKDKNDNRYSVGVYTGKKPTFAVNKSLAAHFKGSVNPLTKGRDDLLITVSDSFLLLKNDLMEMAKSGLIPYILVDEWHTAESQSIYRPKLRRFLQEIKDFLPYCQIAFVTATPNLFSRIDVEVNNPTIDRVKINLTNDETKAVKDIRLKILMGLNVIVFTNNKGILSTLRDEANILECDLKVGETLGRSIVAECILRDSFDAKLIAVSGRGFEGWSFTRDGENVAAKDVHIYFFENRRSEHTSFYVSNLIQAISRARLGADYIEYIRIEKETKPKPDKHVITRIKKFIDKANRDGVENAIKKANKSLLDLITITYSDRGDEYGRVVSLEMNEAIVNLYREKILDDTYDFMDVHKEFFEKRNVVFTDNRDDTPNRLKYKSVNQSTRINNFKANSYYIEFHGLFNNDLQIDASLNWEKPKQFRKGIELYLDRKNYKGDFKPPDRLMKGYKLFRDERRYEAIVRKIRASYDKYYKRKLRNEPKELKDKLERFHESHHRIIPKLIIQFMQPKITSGTRLEYEVFREYTIWVTVNMEVIRIVGYELGVTITELDIVSCFLRIVYAKCNLPLPENVYGDDKKNKLGINKSLNKLHKNPNVIKVWRARENHRKNLNRYNLNSDVVDYLVHTYSDKNKGQFFYDQAFHEMMIIRQLVTQLKLHTDNKFFHDGMVRRHDSELVFNLDGNPDLSWVENLEYLGQIGYFKTPQK